MNYLEIVKIRLKIRWGQADTKEMQHFLELKLNNMERTQTAALRKGMSISSDFCNIAINRETLFFLLVQLSFEINLKTGNKCL